MEGKCFHCRRRKHLRVLKTDKYFQQLLCKQGWEDEIKWRKKQNLFLATVNLLPLPKWEELEEFHGGEFSEYINIEEWE